MASSDELTSAERAVAFLRVARQGAPRRSVPERRRDFREVDLPQEPQALKDQATRCMNCGVPFCMQGCPLGNPIPDFNTAVHAGRFHEAYVRLASTNNFPEFTGRLCPAPCEAACTLAYNDSAVTIEQVEKEIAERAFAEGWVRTRAARKRSGKRIAIVGSGPAGLAAAAQLASVGHDVTIYEAADRIGGLLRYGIPDFKLEKSVLDRRLALLVADGVELQPSVAVGSAGAPTFAELRAEHDALLIAIGAGRPRELEVPGRELPGVCLALDFLERQNRLVAGDADPAPELDAMGKRVVILGGGDTGSDCLGTAHRQGAESVDQIELMPEPPEFRADDNPWPRWPIIYRSSSSHEEGGERSFAVLTKALVGEEKLERLQAVRLEMPQGGRFDPRRAQEVPGSDFELPVDLLILAMGFVGPQTAALSDQLSLTLDARGNVATQNFATSAEGVFAAGDAQRGASLVVWAISDGREAAHEIDSYLRGGPSPLPTRGQDKPFG